MSVRFGFRIAKHGVAVVVGLAIVGGCAPLPTRPPVPAAAFKPLPFETGPVNKNAPIPEKLPYPSRYAAPGGEGVVLGPALQASPPIGTTASGLATGCNPLHYLLDRADANDTIGVDNRFSWWDKTPPAAGPMRPPMLTDLAAARASLICQFHPALARVVGQASAVIDSAGFKFFSWDDASVTSPNQLTDVEFIVRQLRLHSVPVVRDLAKIGGGSERVLVNESAPGYQPDLGGDRLRPSLWIDFAKAQRAVAIEFGTPTDSAHDFNLAGAKLIAYDGYGNVIQLQNPDGTTTALRSDGRAYGGATNITLGDYGYAIGVQDRDGRIGSVELRFDFTHADNLDSGGDPGEKITAQQVVRRIWHEPLPPAAVKQGFVGVSTFQPPPNPPANVIVPPTFRQRFGKDPGPENVAVPFGLDRAMVMIRGMRWQFSDPLPQRVSEFSAGLAPIGFSTIDSNNPALTITPSGRLVGPVGSTSAYHVVVDYTLVAWRSQQTELFGVTVSAGAVARQNDVAVDPMIISDPCPFSDTSLTVERRRELCGPLFGAPQAIGMRMNPAQEISQLDLTIGSETGLASGNGVTLFRTDYNGQAAVAWQQGFHLDGNDDNSNQLDFTGTLLSGTSLRVGPDSLGSPPPDEVRNARAGTIAPRADTGPRDDRSNYGFGPERQRSIGIAWPVIADVAFVGIELLHTQPNGPIEQLDFEVKGDKYNGAIVDWKIGLGINTEPPIIGGLGASRDRFIAATALFGAIDGTTPFRLGAASKHDLYFENGVQGLTQTGADRPGFIQNNSNDALWIDDIVRGTQPNNNLFQFEFLFRRHPMERDVQTNFVRVSEAQLRDRLPLLLRPGERIDIVGRYTPTGASGFLPDSGNVEFRLRSSLTTRLNVLGYGTAIEANPAGEWRPAELIFLGTSPAGMPESKPAFLATTGSTPLLVNRLHFEDETLGYHVQTLPIIESDVMGVRVTCGDATSVCHGQTRLLADTNAGTIALRVRVQP